MEFKSVLPAPEDEFEVYLNPNGEWLAEFAVAEGDDGDQVVTCSCKLSPFVEAGRYEFAFSIGVTSLFETYEPFETQDPRIARAYIPEDAYPHVLPSVINALKALVVIVRPEEIYRVTKGIRLPDHAFAKHELITETLQDMNFEINDSGTDRLGRRFWLMKRM